MTDTPFGACATDDPPTITEVPVSTLKETERWSLDMTLPLTKGTCVEAVVLAHAVASACRIWLNIAVPVEVPSDVRYTVATPLEVVPVPKMILTAGTEVPAAALNICASGVGLTMPVGCPVTKAIADNMATYILCQAVTHQVPITMQVTYVPFATALPEYATMALMTIEVVEAE